jgi:aspartyl-tRNA(Asn)/glutamyl-tRNA(Gln) amidotransferase subunit A
MAELEAMDAAALARAYAKRSLSPVEAAGRCLERAAAAQATLNPFVVIDADGALEAARASEARWASDDALGPLDGVPVTVKDNIAVRGLATRKGSLVASDVPETEDAPSVERLRAAGAVILGKTTMPEFGWKGLSDSPLTGLTRNPWNAERTTGGSSAGAAVCAALGIGRMHLGTDGAGSVRIPAAFCGVLGFKPSYGRVPAHPISVMGELAHLGPLTATVAEAATMLGVMTGPHAKDLTASRDALELGDLGAVAGLRIALSLRLGHVQRIDPAVETAVADAVRVFEALGAHIDVVDPDIGDPVDVLETLWFAGAGFALAPIADEDRAKMDPGLVACAERGARIPASQYIEALLFRRAELARRMARFHERYDLLATPQMPTGALPFGSDAPPAGFGGVAEWGEAWTDWSPFTYPFNITQHPALSLPCGLTPDGLPIGLQLVGALGADGLVLRAGRAFEAALPWARAPSPGWRNG